LIIFFKIKKNQIKDYNFKTANFHQLIIIHF
jgi:hypothetical protein